VGADAIISIQEFWTAPIGALRHYERAGDYAERGEGLGASLLAKDGTAMQITSEILRDGNAVALGEPKVNTDACLMFFAPVLEAWGMPVPPKWIDEATKAQGLIQGQSADKQSRTQDGH
jgi:hypothetical protein